MASEKNNVPVRNVKTKVPKRGGRGTGEYLFNAQQLEFFKSFTEDLDLDKALKAAKVPKSKRAEFLNNPYIKNEMAEIQGALSYHYRMNGKYAAAKHMELFAEVVDEFRSQSGKIKAMFASTAAKMSDTNLKATGQMDNNDASGVKVSVNIDIGDDGIKTVEGTIESNE